MPNEIITTHPSRPISRKAQKFILSLNISMLLSALLAICASLPAEVFLVSNIFFVAALNIEVIKKSFFGQDSISFKTQDGKLHLRKETNNGLLETVGYHDAYSRVSVDKMIKDVLFAATIGLENPAKITKSERTGIRERILEALKANQKLFPESEKSKMNASYVDIAIETRLAKLDSYVIKRPLNISKDRSFYKKFGFGLAGSFVAWLGMIWFLGICGANITKEFFSFFQYVFGVALSIEAVSYLVNVIRKPIFGNENLKLLETEEGNLTLEVEHKKGLLDRVEYHNPYSRVSVDRVIKDVLSKETYGLQMPSEVTKSMRTLISERTLKVLKANEKLFPESEKSKMNTTYINKEIETRLGIR